MQLTYKEAFDKITEAYIKDEIKPRVSKFCFCGTLCNNVSLWNIRESLQTEEWNFPYTYREFKRMEMELFNGLSEVQFSWMSGNIDEDALFNGMCKALEVLRQIHEERGENVDLSLTLNKRKLNEVVV